MKTYSPKSRNLLEFVLLYILIPFCFVIPPALFAIKTCIEFYGKDEISVKIENLPEKRINEILKVRDKINSNESLNDKVQITDIDDIKAVRITLTEVMSEKDKEDLLKLSDDKSYKEAIEVLYNFRNYMRQFWITIKYSNFNTLYLARGFIAWNNIFASLPLIFFLIVIISLKFCKSDNLISRFGCFKWLPIGFLVAFCIIIFLNIWFKNIATIALFCLLLGFYIYIYVKSYSPLSQHYYIAHRYFLRYIYLRHPISFLVGLFYNLIIYLYLWHSIKNPDQLNLHLRLPALAFFAIWSTSLAMWLGPFIMACLQIFRINFIDEYYRNTISTNISDLGLRKKGHRVLLGYGRLGQGVHKELLERRTASVKIEPLIDPSDGTTIRYLRKDMIVVDRDEKIFDHVFTDPSFEKIGVAKIKYRDIKSKKDCQYQYTFSEEELWVPAIIGDVTNESVLDYSNLKDCEFFIDTVKGYDETLKIARVVHDSRELKGIITVSDSAQKELLFPRYSGHGIFFTYVKRQQGISLGETVYPAMQIFLKRGRNQLLPKILVLTDDIRQTHYMIETIVQELKLAGRLNQYIRTCVYPNVKQYDLGITICGNSEEIRGACHPHDPQERREPDFTLDVRRWNACIERCSGPEHADPPHAIYVSSRVILEHPYLTTMEKMVCVYDIKPDIVVISFREPSRLLKTLRDWVGTYQRNGKLFKDVSPNKYKPVIIAGSLGEEQREVRDVLFYYDALPPDAMQSRYPVQAIDCRVDLYKDSREHIAAIADALSEKEAEKEEAIGIHMMIQNRSGITPDILAALGGVSNNTSSDENDEANKQQLSFHYSRYYNCALGAKRKGSNYFFFESNVTLENNTTDQNKDNPSAPKPTNTIHMIQSVLLSLPGKKCLPNEIKELLKSFQVEFGNCDDKNSVVNEINNCQFQATCGPDAFRREMFNLNKHKNYFDTFAKDKVEEEFKRFYLNQLFPKLEGRNKHIHYDRPHAKLYLCCRHGDTPGALAIALNRLLLRKVYITDPGNNDLFNITFLINYFTFNPGIMYEAIYGNLKKPKKLGCRNEIKGRDVIERILICPISDDEACNNSWLEYAKILCHDLGGIYSIYRPERDVQNNTNNTNNNILIYRNDFPPCEIIKRKNLPKESRDSRVPDAGCDICRKYYLYVGKDKWEKLR